jgi:predicted metalloprotease
MSRGARTGGLGGIGLIIFVLIALFLGVDPRMLFQGDTGVDRPYSEAPGTQPPADDEGAQFVATVLGYTEDTWGALFKQMGRNYREPTLVMFSGQVASECGFAQAAMGPFYCPRDEKVYIDLSFYRELRDRFGAPGDFAQAYVIAHEVGHHVQNLLGIAEQVQAARQQASETDANTLSVMMELQADCLAGIWAHHTEQAQQILEQGDIEEGLNAAGAIGDDRLQRQTQGYVVPDAFTHGSSAQRVRWFRTGLESGELQACDTFNADPL